MDTVRDMHSNWRERAVEICTEYRPEEAYNLMNYCQMHKCHRRSQPHVQDKLKDPDPHDQKQLTFLTHIRSENFGETAYTSIQTPRERLY
jgi:hypothetical protein